MIRKFYHFRRDYKIRALKQGDRAHMSSPDMLAIYFDQLEAGLRVPTFLFVRGSPMYWATQITQLTPNAIRVLIEFELICNLLGINPSVNLFRYFYTINKHEDDRWWFYFSSWQKCLRLIDDMPTSINHWKERFFFILEADFPRDFLWRPVDAPSDSTPGLLEHQNFDRIMQWHSSGNTLNY